MPTQEQIDQEERDMALARQLQAEEEQAQSQHRQQRAQQQQAPQQQHQQQQQAHHPSPSHPAGTTLTMSCPTCAALNHIAIAQQHLQHMCGMCHRLLPPASSASQHQPQAQLPGASAARGGGGSAAATGGPAQMQCPACTTMNQVAQRNMNGPTQFVCGSCRTMLTMPAPTQQQRQQAPAASGAVEQGVLVHKVRCGRCPSVNAVKGGSGTQFRCGSCSAVNEIP